MRSRWLGCLLVLAACGDSADDPSGFPPGGYADSGAAAATPGGTTSGTVPGGTTAGTATPGGTTAGTIPGGTTAGTGAATGALPCDVQKVLQEKCQTCHSSPPVGAPAALVTWADLQANSGEKPGTKMFNRIHEKLADKTTPMPPVGRPQLTAAEKTTLETYISGGAKAAAPTSCAPATAGGTTAGSTGTAGMGGTSGSPGGTVQKCDITMELRAHGGTTSKDTTPYSAPTGGDHYEMFWFAPTWTEKMHVIDIQPITDNGAVLHHWLLYQKESGGGADGSHAMDGGLQSSDSALLSGWAPGNKSFDFGTDMGVKTVQGPGGRLGIEIHYNTAGNPANRNDRSGAKICLTRTLRPKELATHWLGTQAIIGLGGMFTAEGTCSVQKESHIVNTSPHMHKTGIHMKTVINKQGGSPIVLTDRPFSFMDQQIYTIDTPTREIVVGPGDTIDTTCTYDSLGPITFGPGTGDEMCYNFIMAWPAGSLSNGTPGLVGGQNTCIDGI